MLHSLFGFNSMKYAEKNGIFQNDIFQNTCNGRSSEHYDSFRIFNLCSLASFNLFCQCSFATSPFSKQGLMVTQTHEQTELSWYRQRVPWEGFPLQRNVPNYSYVKFWKHIYVLIARIVYTEYYGTFYNIALD